MQKILEAIKSNGGQPLLVGGCVRDSIMGLHPKDKDVEVYGMTADALIQVLKQFGKVNLVGVSFGVIKLTTPDGDFDFSLPRRENKMGSGHKGFIVEADSTMTPYEAASRRDFTFNAMAQDPFTGEIYDFFGGQIHLKRGILHATSERFSEDPLRVLRGFQFSGRFNLMVSFETADLCQSLMGEYSTLPKERIWGEFWKWATKSTTPSAGIEFLLDTSWIELFPEINAMRKLSQDPEWHPEGDVLTHTMWVCDAAVEIAIRENLSEMDRGVLVLAALLHDVGKAVTTERGEDGRWRSPGHAQAGVEIAERFLSQIGAPKEIINRVVEMVREHMVHVTSEMTPRTVRRLLSRLKAASVADILFIIEADHSGRPPLPKGLPQTAQQIQEIVLTIGDKIQPILMGRHLLERGIQPGPRMGEILKLALTAQIEGTFSDLEGALLWLSDEV